MKKTRGPTRVLWCGTTVSTRNGEGWTFPPAVEQLLLRITRKKTVFHPFGGRSRFGVRGDIDLGLKPDVIADAWLPPFVKNAFDVVILDPPYHSINQQMKTALLEAASFIAAERVIWFHTQWIPSGQGLTLGRSWLVRVGNHCAVRCVQEFKVQGRPKKTPDAWFTRGPAIKYNRWLVQPERLPFGERQ